jgi:hypothetical protein
MPALPDVHHSIRAPVRSAPSAVLLMLACVGLVSALVLARGPDRQGSSNDVVRAPLTNLEAKAHALAAALASECPPAAAGDLAALDRCRHGLHASAVLRPSLGPITLWGRTAPERQEALADADLVQLAPSTVTGTYLPLLVYDGRVAMDWSAREGLWRIELGARLREREGPNVPPSPLRPEDELSAGLERTEALLIWLEADARTIFAVQVATRGRRAEIAGSSQAGPP